MVAHAYFAFTVAHISAPKPHFLYGYRQDAFDDKYCQIVLDRSLLSTSTQSLLLPFLIVEIKSEYSGMMFQGDNQALGAAAVSLAMLRNLWKRHNSRLTT